MVLLMRCSDRRFGKHMCKDIYLFRAVYLVIIKHEPQFNIAGIIWICFHAAGGKSGSVPPVLHGRLFAGRDCGDEWRVAEHGFQEAPQDQEAADGDVQKSSIRKTRVFVTEYGAIWRRDFFLPLLMIEY